MDYVLEDKGGLYLFQLNLIVNNLSEMKNLFKNFLNRISGKEASFKINNETIKTMINEWYKNPKPTEHKYGHISK